jgi:hydrogenase maturation protein HypF
MDAGGDPVRIRLRFRGVVQGVGFRPAVFRSAVSLGLAGFVQNRTSEVMAEVQGPRARVAAFSATLAAALPGAARLDEAVEEPIAPLAAPEPGFSIRESSASDWEFSSLGGPRHHPIPPDLALCPDCRRELLDPADRRYLHPFISCTQCGPRYSIVERTPFDRESTAMADFPLCPRCLAEYRDPGDRRFHAQALCCPVCGPRLSLLDPAGRPVAGDPILASIAALACGAIVAVHGLGGFHLAADPLNDETLRRLRRDKERGRKPFALMACDLAAAAELCAMTEDDAVDIASARAPIMILPAKDPDRMPLVSPTGTLGVMLPYSPLHLLLFVHPRASARFRWLVMTSGNRRDEPIATDPPEALERLAGTADLFLCHDRRIVRPTDDSVLRPARPVPVALRRSRGFVPGPVGLGRPLDRTVLAAGGDLKSAPAIGRGTAISLSPHVGDLDDPRALASFERHVDDLLSLYGGRPDAVLYDPHPLYRSGQWALAAPWEPKVPVQHHHAHVLSVMAEHGLDEAIGLSFDGTGFGGDGTVWGGEFMHATRDGFERLGSFGPFRLPGGDAAVRHPLRIAAAVLGGAGLPVDRLLPELPIREAGAIEVMLARNLNVPVCSSLGRIFDAAAALLGLVRETDYEGEGPMLLEGLAARAWSPDHRGDAAGGTAGARGLVPLVRGTPFRLDPVPLLEHIAKVRGAGPAPALALLFHVEIAAAALAGAQELRRLTGLATLALSGGVFQNVLLRELLVPRLEAAGFDVRLNLCVPPGDGGLAVGQAYRAV